MDRIVRIDREVYVPPEHQLTPVGKLVSQLVLQDSYSRMTPNCDPVLECIDRASASLQTITRSRRRLKRIMRQLFLDLRNGPMSIMRDNALEAIAETHDLKRAIIAAGAADELMGTSRRTG